MCILFLNVCIIEKMTFIELLKKYDNDLKSVRKLLSRFSVTRWSNFSEPLMKLHDEEVIALLFDWIIHNLKNYNKITLRILEDHTKDVYEMTLQHRGGLYITEIRLCEELKGKMLYYWNEEITYNNLTVPVIEKSIKLADYCNWLKLQKHMQLQD